MSNDDIDSHCRFGESLGGLQFPHVSDVDLNVARAYNVVNDSGQGCRRSLFIVDREGNLRHVNRAYQVNETAQYEVLFEILSQLS